MSSDQEIAQIVAQGDAYTSPEALQAYIRSKIGQEGLAAQQQGMNRWENAGGWHAGSAGIGHPAAVFAWPWLVATGMGALDSALGGAAAAGASGGAGAAAGADGGAAGFSSAIPELPTVGGAAAGVPADAAGAPVSASGGSSGGFFSNLGSNLFKNVKSGGIRPPMGGMDDGGNYALLAKAMTEQSQDEQRLAAQERMDATRRKQRQARFAMVRP